MPGGADCRRGADWARLDLSSRGIPNAQIDLTESSTCLHQKTVTTSSGDYVFINLSPGTYQIDVDATGFEHLARTRIRVITGQAVSADLVLSLGSDRQTVTVSSDLPVMQSANSNIETNVSHSMVSAMPLNT